MGSYSNFVSGALVMRVWRFDGSAELLAKFQYYSDAKDFAQSRVDHDKQRGGNPDGRYFYLAVCEAECSVQAFFDPSVVKENAS